MPSVAGLGTTFNLPNYGGEILQVTPSETPFLTAIGGLNEQGEVVTSTEFEWQTQDLGTPSQPETLEGADAPALGERSRGNVSNIVQIFQRAFGVSYTRQAARGQMAGINSAQANPVADEIAYQTQIVLTEAARDINYTLLRGTYNKPANNAAARKTRGLLAAITTNVTDLADAALSKLAVLDLLQDIWDSHGINSAAEPTIMVNATLKRGITKLFITDANYRETSREVGGVTVTMIETDFGRFNIMLDRVMPADELAVVHLGLCKPAYLLVPDKGFLFVEPLAKTGAQDKYQLYGEVGLWYGAESAHGKLTSVGPVVGA